MGSRGDAYVNAMAEDFFSTLECECLAKYSFTLQAHARLVLVRNIEGWYNPHRRHSALGQCSPLAFEHLYAVPSSVHDLQEKAVVTGSEPMALPGPVGTLLLKSRALDDDTVSV